MKRVRDLVNSKTTWLQDLDNTYRRTTTEACIQVLTQVLTRICTHGPISESSLSKLCFLSGLLLITDVTNTGLPLCYPWVCSCFWFGFPQKQSLRGLWNSQFIWKTIPEVAVRRIREKVACGQPGFSLGRTWKELWRMCLDIILPNEAFVYRFSGPLCEDCTQGGSWFLIVPLACDLRERLGAK